MLSHLWPAVATHKNVFFDLITTTAGPPDEAAIAADALGQLRGYQAPPRVEVSRDLRGRYDEGDCRDHVDEDRDAVDVADREVTYFLWHSGPWKLRYEGDARQTYPWPRLLGGLLDGAGQGILEDDSVGRCAQR